MISAGTPAGDLDAALARELLRLAHQSHARGDVLRDTRVVILAGGRGRRLQPYTSVLPKPLMPLGNRAILEILVHQLAGAGFGHLTFCVGYLSHLIKAVFENGANPGLDLRWVHEDEPLGTAGPLRLVEGLDETFLVMNGDLLTTLDYEALLEHHHAHGNLLTIASHRRTIRSDYGVVRIASGGDDQSVIAYQEKPELSWNVSMGIYVLEPAVRDLIPPGQPFDFPDLVQAMLREGLPIGAFAHEGLWLDIGRHEDYLKAVELWEHGSHLAAAERAAADD